MGLKKRNKANPEFSLASLTDVVFLLLIFFMLTSTLVTQNALNLKLPSASNNLVASPALAVSVKASGEYFLGGTPTSLEDIESFIQRKAALGKSPKETTVTILAEKNCPIEYVVNIMDIANRLKVGAILATAPKGEQKSK